MSTDIQKELVQVIRTLEQLQVSTIYSYQTAAWNPHQKAASSEQNNRVCSCLSVEQGCSFMDSEQ
jgi:hypothetical protein